MDRLGTVAIIGVGLIGGSIGQALRALGLAERVVGIGRNEARLAEAVERGAVDSFTTELPQGVAEAEVAIVCTPVTQVAGDVIRAAEHGPASILVTDAGSTKRRIVETIEGHARARAVFVGGHPIAGSERSGVAHARADLLGGRVCVLTPTGQTPADRLERARRFWSGLGCRLIEMDPTEHDEALALTSHLPHAVAAALAASVPADSLPLAAGAYRDGTRVAGADAGLWAGIFRENRAAILKAVSAFQDQLALFKTALAANDEDAIRQWWDLARTRRGGFETRHAPPAVPDEPTAGSGQEPPAWEFPF